MRSDDLQHSIEIEGYWREMPSGRKVWVKSYSRKGSAAEEDRSRRATAAYQHHSAAVDMAKANLETWKKHPDAFKKQVKTPVYSEWEPTGRPGEKTSRVMYKKSHPESINATEAYAPYEKAVSDREAAVEREMEREATLGENIKFAAIDVKEEVEVFVNNAIEEASFGAQAAADIVVGASKKVVEVVTSGWNAVKSFFGGLFGRR